MLKFLKQWTLPIAILIGSVFYKYVGAISFLTPYLIFFMLLLAFCKISPRQMKPHRSHLLLLAIQLLGSIGVYYLLAPYNVIVAQGAMMTMLAPTATAATVVTSILGGDVAYLTTYLLLINVSVAFSAPAIFSVLGTNPDMHFWQSFFYICQHIGPLMLLPLILAMTLRKWTPRWHAKLLEMHGLAYYLWAIAVVAVMGKTVSFIVERGIKDMKIEIALGLVSIILLVGQFFLGRYLGHKRGEPISSGQGLGQKNTVIAIWMSQMYLDPLSSVAPAACVIWQNVINSWQMWHHEKKQIKKR